jgi:hypothetical protein
VAEKFTAQYWRMRAEEARTHAEEMHEPIARGMMLDIAVGYDRLAEWADKLERDKSGELSGGRGDLP